MTETLRWLVVRMKAKGMALSAIAREVGRSKSVISKIIEALQRNRFIQALQKRLVIHVKQMH